MGKFPHGEITPLPPERCRLRWTLAVRLPGVLGKAARYIEYGLSFAQNRMLKALKRVAREGSSQR
jgi:hypothetical protein